MHEAYLRLVDVDAPQQWDGRGHFFAAAAESMRRILVESARRRKRTKRGGDINLYFTPVSDLSPLKGMPLEHVIIAETNVTDLGLLKEMSTLKILNCGRSITDLSPLKGLALEELHGDFQPARDGEIFRSIKTLKKINDKPAGEFWMGGEK